MSNPRLCILQSKFPCKYRILASKGYINSLFQKKFVQLFISCMNIMHRKFCGKNTSFSPHSQFLIKFFLKCYNLLSKLSLSLNMEQEQFKREIVPLRKQLLLYSRSKLPNPEDAEDVVQEVMLRLWYKRKELNKYDSVKALSVEITKNLCLNRLKVAQRKMENVEDVVIESELPSPDAQLEQKDDVRYVLKIIDRLPELQQTILRMRHIDGFEIDEIAALTGSRPEAVRMNLSRARKRVKEIFIQIQ